MSAGFGWEQQRSDLVQNLRMPISKASADTLWANHQDIPQFLLAKSRKSLRTGAICMLTSEMAEDLDRHPRCLDFARHDSKR